MLLYAIALLKARHMLLLYIYRRNELHINAAGEPAVFLFFFQQRLRLVMASFASLPYVMFVIISSIPTNAANKTLFVGGKGVVMWGRWW